MAASQKPSAIPVQNFAVTLQSYPHPTLVKPQPILINHNSSLNQPLMPRGIDKRYPAPTNGVPKPSTSPVPMSPKYPTNPVQSFPQPLPPSKLPVASSRGSVSQSSRQRTVEKAMRARLYLMEQPGPNTFLVTGDSNEIRFKVTVGTQVSSSVYTHVC